MITLSAAAAGGLALSLTQPNEAAKADTADAVSDAIAYMPPQMSLMIQVSSVAAVEAAGYGGISSMVSALELVRSYLDRQGLSRVPHLVLVDVAPTERPASVYRNVLDVLMPYLPFGARSTFSNVFVGTIDIPSASNGAPIDPAFLQSNWPWDPYLEGVVDPGVRAWHVDRSTEAAVAFEAAYPTLYHHWYITWEAYLPTLMRRADVARFTHGMALSDVRASTLAYQQSLVAALSAVLANRTVLWSPSLNQPLAQIRVDGMQADVDANVKSYFGSLAASMAASPNSSSSGIWLHPQDALSRSQNLIGGSYNNTPQTRAEWITYLRNTVPTVVRDVALNAELFIAQDSNGTAMNSRQEVTSRLEAYRSLGVPLGASFDLDNWSRTVRQVR